MNLGNNSSDKLSLQSKTKSLIRAVFGWKYCHPDEFNSGRSRKSVLYVLQPTARHFYPVNSFFCDKILPITIFIRTIIVKGIILKLLPQFLKKNVNKYNCIINSIKEDGVASLNQRNRRHMNAIQGKRISQYITDIKAVNIKEI